MKEETRRLACEKREGTGTQGTIAFKTVIKILTGDCRDLLKTLDDESVHCVMTSPPYWGLRDYGTAADRLGRNAILIELNPKYAEMAQQRITRDGPLFADVNVGA